MTYLADTHLVSPAVFAQNQDTCADLDDLRTNVNPTLLSECSRNSDCTQVVCQTTGELETLFSSTSFTLMPCETPPGVLIELFDTNGNSSFQFLIIDSVVIRGGNVLETIAVHVLVESTANLFDITVSKNKIKPFWCVFVVASQWSRNRRSQRAVPQPTPNPSPHPPII